MEELTVFEIIKLLASLGCDDIDHDYNEVDFYYDDYRYVCDMGNIYNGVTIDELLNNSVMISQCCGVLLDNESLICGRCKEHC